MPKIKFIGRWSAIWQKKFNVPKGYLLIKPDQFYRRAIGSALLKIEEYQNKKLCNLQGAQYEESDYLRPLEIQIDYHFRKRTLDQNALIWSLYSIEANELNAGQSGHKDQTVTPMELYCADLEEYAERETITTSRKNLGYYMSEYRIIESVTLETGEAFKPGCIKDLNINADHKITIVVVRSTSKLNTKEMGQWVDRLFNRIAYNGIQVTTPGEIAGYWRDWREYLNENKVILHEALLTQSDYKSFNPICEACGKFIGYGGGELAHIHAIGMGGDRSKEPKKNYSSNWLHLCHDCHIEKWHKVGVKKFVKEYKHLKYKVLTALNRKE